VPKLKNVKQELFCQEYLIDGCAKDAAIRAGYAVKNAKQQGSALKLKPRIAARIDELIALRAKRTAITQDRVLQELAAIGFADIGDFAGVAVTEGLDKAGNPIDIRQVEIKPTDELDPVQRAAIASIKQGTNGIEVKLNDKIKALELIARHLGMLNDKTEVDVKGAFEVNIKVVE
jgi:phage terminase small subunit